MSIKVYLTVTSVLIHSISATYFPPEVENHNISKLAYCQAEYPNPSSYKPMDDSTLLFVQAISRHGDRTPAYFAPKDTTIWDICPHKHYEYAYANTVPGVQGGVKIDTYTDDSDEASNMAGLYWKGNCFTGQLSRKGVNQMEAYGSQLRKVYVDKMNLLNKKLEKDTIRVRHTNVPRTLASAEGLMTGFYPSGTGGNTTIGFTSFPQEKETMYPNSLMCPRISQLGALMRTTPEYQSYFNNSYSDALRLNKILGYGSSVMANSTLGYRAFADVFWAIECHGKPKLCNEDTCITEDDIQLSLKNTLFELTYTRRLSPYADEYNKLTGGAFFSQLNTELAKQIDYDMHNQCAEKTNNGTVRMSIYAGHDETIVPMLAIFKTNNIEDYLVPYAGSIHIELWRNNTDKKYYIRALYNGNQISTLSDPTTNEPWCNLNKCDWNTYQKYLEQYIPKNIYQECKLVQ
ncbi:Counting factor 60 [Zancudomyces culisetae]|uniref:Counting factor 60 n=1 Tax=Zancudomyces culisetae TaxID=1213189 RepID=A0A1R1PC19_ZANCU|nr:Counting factor 60 [Zancudomyces culisetae]|eukprot:OMH78500.1 Counting factor 60 [Zancudomyces culisetae]